MSENAIAQIEAIDFRYPDGTEALQKIVLSIRRGERIGLAGENGSGKTTLCKNLNGLLRPTGGRVLIDGNDISSVEVTQISQKVGYLFQNPDNQIFCSNVFDEVAFGLRNQGLGEAAISERVGKYLSRLKIDQYIKTPPLMLSLGLRRMVSIASILAMEQDLIILDEPTAWLDHGQSQLAIKAIDEAADSGKTILLVTHNMRLLAELTDRMIVLSKGRIIADGSTSKILGQSNLIKTAGLAQLHITSLANRIGLASSNDSIVTVESFINALRERRSGGGVLRH